MQSSQDENFWNALLAIQEKDTKNLNKLLQADPDLIKRKMPTGGRATLLHIAVEQMKPDMVALLLSYGANPHSKDINGNSPLSRARMLVEQPQYSATGAEIIELLNPKKPTRALVSDIDDTLRFISSDISDHRSDAYSLNDNLLDALRESEESDQDSDKYLLTDMIINADQIKGRTALIAELNEKQLNFSVSHVITPSDFAWHIPAEDLKKFYEFLIAHKELNFKFDDKKNVTNTKDIREMLAKPELRKEIPESILPYLLGETMPPSNQFGVAFRDVVKEMEENNGVVSQQTADRAANAAHVAKFVAIFRGYGDFKGLLFDMLLAEKNYQDVIYLEDKKTCIDSIAVASKRHPHIAVTAIRVPGTEDQRDQPNLTKEAYQEQFTQHNSKRSTLEFRQHELNQKKLELDFLHELCRIMSNKALIDDAVAARALITIDGKHTREVYGEARDITLSDIEDIFNADGSVDKAKAEEKKVKLDDRVKFKTLAEYGVTTSDLSDREILILDAVISVARENTITSNFKKQITGSEEIDIQTTKQTELTATTKKMIGTIMPQLGDVHLTDPLSHQLNEHLLTDIDRKSWQTKLDILVQRIEMLGLHYSQLGRSEHKKDIQKLLARINEKIDDPKERFAVIVGELEKEFLKEQQHYCRSFLGKDKDAMEFIGKINTTENKYHYPRLLAMILQSTNIDHPGSSDLRGINVIKIPDTDSYRQMIPALLSIDEAASFNEFEKSLQKISPNFSRSQIYRLFRGQDSLDAGLVKKLWPDLDGIKGSTLRGLISGRNDVEIESNDSLNAIKQAIRIVQAHQENLFSEKKEYEIKP